MNRGSFVLGVIIAAFFTVGLASYGLAVLMGWTKVGNPWWLGPQPIVECVATGRVVIRDDGTILLPGEESFTPGDGKMANYNVIDCNGQEFMLRSLGY